MRARIDTRAGLWPAFWALGVQGRWPPCGEIDIMEHYRGLLLANVAWGSKQPGQAKWDDSKKPLREFPDRDWPRQFRVWRMDWDEKSVNLSVDGLLLNSTELKDTVNEDPEEKNPVHQPHYIMGTWTPTANSGLLPRCAFLRKPDGRLRHRLTGNKRRTRHPYR